MNATKNPTTNKASLNKLISDAQKSLEKRLNKLPVESLGISEYNQRYVGKKLASNLISLQIYKQILELALTNIDKPLEELVILDYGGGSGFLSFLARECGIGTVIYNDIFDVSCNDVKIISKHIGIELDHIVCGDVEDVVSFFREKGIVVDAIVSYDCLEHIYDVKHFFAQLHGLCDYPFRIVFGSGANIKNPRYVRNVSKLQTRVESEDSDAKWGHKESDALEAFVSIRRRMIKSYAPDLSDDDANQLATATRGLIERDIQTCVDEFKTKGNISYKPDHPTNTCDPNTGNWCEHLMEPEFVEQVVTAGGFEAKVIPGKYTIPAATSKKIVKKFLNVLIQTFGRSSMAIAPFYVVNGRRK